MAIDYDDPIYAERAAAILRRHERGDPEANITSAVRDFLIATQLATPEEIVEEVHPGDANRKAVDLSALDTYIEFKRRTGTPRPNHEWIDQLDGYLEASQEAGRGVRMGVLTDGKHWFLRWPGAGEVRTEAPYSFVLYEAQGWIALYEWLRDHALGASERIRPERSTVSERFGVDSLLYERDLDALRRLYSDHRESETVQVKRRLWLDLLRAAAGEFADSVDDLDDLFVRHTYLTAVTGMAVQARFRIDITELARTDAGDLLTGRRFRDQTGLEGVVETDFFSWPAEVGGEPLLRTVARHLARFDWGQAPADIAAILYETVIPAEERRQLGEYYTPHWLVQAMLDELVPRPLDQRVLDPACGSGTFIAEAVSRFVAASEEDAADPVAALGLLREGVVGIDTHPVAVHLARAAWTIAAQPLIERAVKAGFRGTVSAPIYLGDALQLQLGAGDLFAEAEVRVRISDESRRELIFPTSLVERADIFDSVMGAIAGAIERGEDPLLELGDHPLSDVEREGLAPAVSMMSELHAAGRNHIWAYYTRNLVRPVALARRKADVVIGNPPWLNYNQTADVLRDGLQELSKKPYDIWVGGQYATQQDVAGLFFARCVDLYLDSDGVIGMVMPHSALRAGQYKRWRSGRWGAHRVDFGFQRPWDLEQLKPNDFFPIPASVAFARRDAADAAVPLEGTVERWEGGPGDPDVRRSVVALDAESGEGSPYRPVAANGATVYPRRLFMVEEIENPARIKAPGTIRVRPRRGKHDKAPWNKLDLSGITGRVIDVEHIFNVFLGENVAPYVALSPLRAALPLRRDAVGLAEGHGADAIGGVQRSALTERMRQRWRAVSDIWDSNKGLKRNYGLLANLDYHGKLSKQIAWRNSAPEEALRVVYSKSGQPTAALIRDRDAFIENTLYWVECNGEEEAHYLLSVINSVALREAAEPFMSKGLWGPRDLHKHLWNLPIPRYKPEEPLHADLAAAGRIAAIGAAAQLTGRDGIGHEAARELLRDWLAQSEEGQEVERLVATLLLEAQ